MTETISNAESNVFHKTVVTSDQLQNSQGKSPKAKFSEGFKLPSESSGGEFSVDSVSDAVKAESDKTTGADKTVAGDKKEESKETVKTDEKKEDDKEEAVSEKDKRKEFLAKTKAEREYREKETKLKAEQEKVKAEGEAVKSQVEKANKLEAVLREADKNPIALLEAAGYEWDDVIANYIAGKYKKGAPKPEPTQKELAEEAAEAKIKAFKDEQAKAKEEEAKQKDIEKQEALNKRLEAFQKSINKTIDDNPDQYPLCKGEEAGEIVFETWKQAALAGSEMTMLEALKKTEEYIYNNLAKYKNLLLKDQGNKGATDKKEVVQKAASSATKKTLNNKLGISSADIVSSKRPSHKNKDEWTKDIASRVKLSFDK